MSHMSSVSQKTMAIAMAAAVAVAGPVGAGMIAPAATAQPLSQPSNAAQARQIDPNATGTFTIQKLLGEPLAPGETVADRTGYAGVQFRIEQVDLGGLALDTAAGWERASEIGAGSVAAAPIVAGSAQTVTTNDQGAATADLKVGVYRVTELADADSNHSVSTPFLITVPHFEDGKVVYDLTISPKNQDLQPTKSTVNANATVGDRIFYNIDAPIPAFGPNPEGDQLTISDQLIPELQWTDDADHEPLVAMYTNHEDANANTNPTQFVRGTDYTVSHDASTNTLTIDFTQAGLQQLRNARGGNPQLTVGVIFPATLTAIPAGGTVNNTAQVTYNNNDTKPTKPGDNPGDNTTRTEFADVAVTKQLNGQNVDEGKNGAGAQFQIFRCTNQGGNSWSVANDAQAERLLVNGQVTTTITAEGAAGQAAVARATGLNRDRRNGEYADYCAVETKGVDGYLNNPEPQPLTFQAATDPAAATTGTLSGTVNNAKNSIWGNLPATGERTMLILLALGLVLFGGGAAYQLSRRNAA